MNFMHLRFGTLCSIPTGGSAYTAYEDGTEISETSAHKM